MTDTPDHGAVHGVGRVRQDRAMTHKRTNGTAGGMSGRASAETRLPALSDDHRSRAAIGRSAKLVRDLIGLRSEAERAAERLAGALEGRVEGRTSLLLIETLRMMVLNCVASLSEREEPVTTEELACLALILKRIEDTDKLRRERERKHAKAASRAGDAAQPGGLSPETVFAIRRAVERGL